MYEPTIHKLCNLKVDSEISMGELYESLGEYDDAEDILSVINILVECGCVCVTSLRYYGRRLMFDVRKIKEIPIELKSLLLENKYYPDVCKILEKNGIKGVDFKMHGNRMQW